MTILKGDFVTAVGGGSQITDVLHTTALSPGALEKFRLWFAPVTKQHAFQTMNGQFLTAVNGGGLTWDTIHSNVTQIGPYERFQLPNIWFNNFAIQTVRGFYLTAPGQEKVLEIMHGGEQRVVRLLARDRLLLIREQTTAR